MQQGRKMPKQEGLREQVRADLEAAGVHISRSRELYGEVQVAFDISNLPKSFLESRGFRGLSTKDRADAIGHLRNLVEADLGKIKRACEDDSTIRSKIENNSEYRREMDVYVRSLETNLESLETSYWAARVQADLEGAGVPVADTLRLCRENRAFLKDPSKTTTERANAARDLLTLLDGEINKLDALLKNSDNLGVKMNLTIPKYREAMENQLQLLRETSIEIRNAPLSSVPKRTA